MNYRVLIPLDIKREILKLPTIDLQCQALDHLLRELPSDPNKFLGQVVAPLALRAYNFVVNDKQGRPYWCVAHLDGIDPASKPDILVTHFRFTDYDPIADLPPAGWPP